MKMKKLKITVIFLLATFLGFAQEIIFDADSNAYHTVTIGDQVWMKENLKVSRFNNGDKIETCGNLYLLEDQIYKYQWVYDDNPEFLPTYGRLYTWFTVTDERGVCPEGWRIPTENDFKSLVKYLLRDAGVKLMQDGDGYWDKRSVKRTNTSGFSALPGGRRYHSYNFDHQGQNALFWTSTSSGAESAIALSIHFSQKTVNVVPMYHKNDGLSIRCIKNE
jgi:uncharacterized protein (TIGR02145 family)